MIQINQTAVTHKHEHQQSSPFLFTITITNSEVKASLSFLNALPVTFNIPSNYTFTHSVPTSFSHTHTVKTSFPTSFVFSLSSSKPISVHHHHTVSFSLPGFRELLPLFCFFLLSLTGVCALATALLYFLLGGS